MSRNMGLFNIHIMFKIFSFCIIILLTPFYNFKGGTSNCTDIKYSPLASSFQDLWFPKVDGQTEIFYSYDACLPENKVQVSNDISGKVLNTRCTRDF